MAALDAIKFASNSSADANVTATAETVMTAGEIVLTLTDRIEIVGLFDMHGNAAEWTLSSDAAYPHRCDDGRNTPGDG